jgi:HlyD family secretion protein
MQGTSSELETGAVAPGTPSAEKKRRDRRRAVGRLIKRVTLALVVLVVGGLLVVAMLPKPVSVDATSVTRGPMRVTVDEDGTTRVKDRYVVSAPLAGSMARLELDPGDSVKPGSVLARIVPVEPALLDERSRLAAEARVSATQAAQRQAVAQVERARAHRDFTRKDVTRQRQLFERGSITREMLDQAELAERTAGADQQSATFGKRVADYEVEMARAALGRMKPHGGQKNEDQLLIPSPVGGRVLKVLHKSEGVLQAGTPLLELGDPKALEVVVDVLTSDAVNIRPGAEVEIVEWGGPAIPARVRTIEPSAFTRISALGVEEQRVNVVIDLDPPRERWAALGDGYRVKAEIVTHRAASTLEVPESAVFRHDSGWAVFRLSDGTARVTPVEIGLRTPRQVEIKGGLDEGDRVVLHPSDRVRDGVRVVAR